MIRYTIPLTEIQMLYMCVASLRSGPSLFKIKLFTIPAIMNGIMGSQSLDRSKNLQSQTHPRQAIESNLFSVCSCLLQLCDCEAKLYRETSANRFGRSLVTMATSFTLNMNEDVIFKHPASMKAIPGTLYFTTLRVTWVATASAHAARNALLPWTQIRDDKYSKSTDEKQRCMIRFLSTSGDTFIFLLTGSPISCLRDELERAKLAVKRGRQGSSGKGDIPTKKPVTAASTSHLGSNNSDQPPEKHIRTEAERRELLLSADSELRHLYTELVVGGVINSTEFWSTRSQLLSDHEGRDTASHRGMASSLLCDVQHAEVTTNGIRKFQLTPETVMDIFQMYPHVLQDYTAKVPEQMTRDEFWIKYFQHEMFNKRGSSQQRTLSVSSQNFLSAKRPMASTNTSSRVCRQENLSRRVAGEMDLTQTYGDYHMPERLDPEDTEFRPTSTSEKYKRKGTLVLEEQVSFNHRSQSSIDSDISVGSGASQSKRPRVSHRERHWETILNKENPDEDVIPLHLGGKKFGHTQQKKSSISDITQTMTAHNTVFVADPGLEKRSGSGDYESLFPSVTQATVVLRREQGKLIGCMLCITLLFSVRLTAYS